MVGCLYIFLLQNCSRKEAKVYSQAASIGDKDRLGKVPTSFLSCSIVWFHGLGDKVFLFCSNE